MAKMIDDSIYDMSDKDLVRMLRAYTDHKKAVRSCETWKPDHFLDLVEEAINRLEKKNGRD